MLRSIQKLLQNFNWKKCTIIDYVYLAGAGSKTGLLVWPVGLQFMFLISFPKGDSILEGKIWNQSHMFSILVLYLIFLRLHFFHLQVGVIIIVICYILLT